MSRTQNFSLPQISPLLKRRNTSKRSFVPKEPKRSEEFPIEVVFYPDLGPDSTDDQIRTHIRIRNEFSSDEVRELIQAKLSLNQFVVLDQDEEDSVPVRSYGLQRVLASTITSADEDNENSVLVRTYGTSRDSVPTITSANNHQQRNTVTVDRERMSAYGQQGSTSSAFPNSIRETSHTGISSLNEEIRGHSNFVQRTSHPSNSSGIQSSGGIEKSSNCDDDFSTYGTDESVHKNFVQSLRVVGRQNILVSRESLVDSIAILISKTFDPYTNPKVQFIGEAGIDMGALRRTWLYETGQKLVTENTWIVHPGRIIELLSAIPNGKGISRKDRLLLGNR
ncbi:unnamed protein product [Allacma fusca]|uniref:Uncharacterized protein n=1 Tax=Allacma fusca TaxID=39272 RepID=A0A8J2NZI6_9HEXA|nr:unnamed protein product [Allacma fusca]